MSAGYRKPWTTKRGETLEADLELLIGDLCTQWGFCNYTLLGADLIRDHTVITGDLFADAILIAEGMNPLMEVEWRRRIKRLFCDRYGQAAVSEATYLQR